MQISPAYASKLIRQKNEQIRQLLAQEKEMSTTTACLDEDVTELRSQYDFQTFQEKVETLNREVVALKHAINLFNVSTVLPGLGYTIDAALVRMKILSDQKTRFAAMKRVQPVSRIGGYGNKQPEYIYRNYEATDVECAYETVESELTNIQFALDKANLESVITVNFE